ncbi:CHC2 zinc finger domain-containing protein [Rhizobium rhizogenes]|uniref:CHC2 zinc finger domain-containing protein n=1 Tax=Rhizobium rhizogenes TaxID=359 RepID=UPI0015716F4A|nr:CHC2 zinc finger domain-containing protein [Rhizobium rhizogenes]NTF82459.1 toprim domain-containing protein [Rhizobium rhizogenes]
MAKNNRVSKSELSRLFDKADILGVATRIGLQVDVRNTRPRRAICPFHADKDPSLHLYNGSAAQGGRDHYHCFVCGAHGDVISLIQNVEQLSFWQSVERLAEIEGVTLSVIQRDAADRFSGANVVQKTLEFEDSSLREFASQRGFLADFLRLKGVGTLDLRSLIKRSENDRITEEQLTKAGIIRREELPGNTADLYGTRLKGFFSGRRIVTTIRNWRGDTVGFAARALDDLKPKYLYSYNFPKRDILFGEFNVFESITTKRRGNDNSSVDLYIVEGIFDVLRLEELGQLALGVLGAQITSGQIESLKRLIKLIEAANCDLRIHIFFDRDDAGFRGAHDAILRILQLLKEGVPFALDVVWPIAAAEKVDPDSFLRGSSEDDGRRMLGAAAIAPLQFLAAFRFSSDPRAIDWKSVGRLRMASSARSIALSVPGLPWSRVDLLADAVGQDEGLQEFAAFVESYAGETASATSKVERSELTKSTGDDRSGILSALTLGRSSTSRREYPLDDDEWERLAIAASPLFHIHRSRLEVGDGPSSPYLTREVPKGNGRYRLKSGPSSHDALLQQYALIELLRDRDDCPSFAEAVPAVRYSNERSASSQIYCTGKGASSRPLSFAYQIDMAIVNGLVPPRREGIFRPYFDCWRSFIDHLAGCIRQFRHHEMQILRLDITGFYDHVRRDVVAQSLTPPLELALQALATTNGDVASFAPLFKRGEIADPAQRAEAFSSFLLKHSFGYEYHDPVDGKVKAADGRRGIPQGPDLSAYLANISLFDLDSMMEEEIARLNGVGSSEGDDTISAAYGRYVDDVVIICRDIETAFQLRRKIEARIASKGLSLNRKNVIPAPMTRSEARDWITDNRSGFGFSGPLADLPQTDAMDPLADAGEIDRKTALGLIYDPDLDNLDAGPAALSKIAVALRAPDIRFGDRANAYRRLWCLAADETKEDSSTATLAERYFQKLRQCEPVLTVSEGQAERFDLAMASLEGLDRALRANHPVGTLDEGLLRRVAFGKIALSKAVIAELFSQLAFLIVGEEKQSAFLRRYDVRCQFAIISRFAAELIFKSPEKEAFLIIREVLEPGGIHEALPNSIRSSLFKFDEFFANQVDQLVISRGRTVDSTMGRLNNTLVKLQRLAKYGESEEPSPFEINNGDDPNDLVRIVNDILTVWCQNSDETNASTLVSDMMVELDAAASLINITYSRFAEVAARRARLRFLIAGTVAATPIPSPPGLETSGILLWCNDGRLLLATTVEANATPIGVEWRSAESSTVEGVKILHAKMPTDYVLLANSGRNWEPAQIAALYRAAYPIFLQQLNPDSDFVPVPTAFSFFARQDESTFDSRSLVLLSWPALRSSVDGHAFVRNGAALEARGVHSDGADLWRLGWSVRDVCERTEVLPEDENGLDIHAAAALDEHFHRKEAIISRVVPRLSGADRWGPGRSETLRSIPTRLERALTLLEQFANTTSASDAASCVLAAAAEGMYMGERLKTYGDVAVPGRPAMLMVKSARRVSQAIPEVTKHWPKSHQTLLPFRRTAAVWMILSQKVAQSHPEFLRQSDGLSTLHLSLEVLAAVTDLRAFSFELADSLSAKSIEILARSEVEHGWLSDIVGPELLLVEDENHEAIDLSLETQSRGLLQSFCSLLTGKKNGLGLVRDRISPAGWVVIAAVLLQIMPVRQEFAATRPNLWPMDADRIAKAQEALRHLLEYFACGSDADENANNWPWDAFKMTAARRPKDVVSILRSLSSIAGMEVTTEVSWLAPRTGETQSGRQIIRLADGSSVSLAEWQIDVAHIKRERGTATEFREIGKRLQFAYSVTRQGDQVRGVHLVSRQLALAAFVGEKKQADELPDQTNAPNSANENKPETFTFKAPDSDFDSAGSKGDRTSRTSWPSADLTFEQIERLRRKSWDVRKNTKNAGMHRVALVQWDVTDSYYSPARNAGKQEGLITRAGEAATALEVAKGGVFLSTAEHRRRELLKQVVKACIQFGVDGLVLPEYSLRPETVNWLSRHLKQQGLPLTVWCGTFRVPDGSQLEFRFPSNGNVPYRAVVGEDQTIGFSRWEHHTAVLTCIQVSVSPDMGVRVEHHARAKRYPSAAVGELIRPPSDQWRPLLENELNPFKLGTFVLELICSEMFPHASSANFIGIIEENNDLAARYGITRSSEPMVRVISNDIYEFAKWTAYRNVRHVAGASDNALIRGERLQRTLIVLPAMTNRSADYHIFGQNQYLAAGLVTVFCNAVAPPVGRGQSGFIGLDGWKQTEALHTPYGSKAPGIFQLNGEHSGALGTTEAAMVIADLDLWRTADQRPRPHYQHRSLKLVAHLPLIFATEVNGEAGEGSYPNGSRGIRVRAVDSESLNFEGASAIIGEALETEQDWRAVGLSNHMNKDAGDRYANSLNTTMKALKILELFADDPLWLKKRTESFEKERHEYPPISPLPALVDWIYVDDRWKLPITENLNVVIDAYSSDLPYLIVPGMSKDEPSRE